MPDSTQASDIARKPRLLETHGCQGCAHIGYARAGWDVTGVDINHNHAKYYPGELVIGDAADYIREHGHEYDAIHVSPPCQYYTRGNAKAIKAARAANGGAYPDEVNGWLRSIPPIREAVLSTGKPYVLENVRDARWDMVDPVLLCGCMFDLSVRDFTCTSPGEHAGTCDTENGVTVHLERGRLFETNWTLTAPRRCEGEGQPRNNHPSHEWVAGSYGGARRDKFEARYIRKGGYVPPDMELVKRLLGVDHNITWNGLYEGLPPAYTEHIGLQLLAQIRQEVAA